MTQLARTIRIVPGIALVLSAIALVACGGQTRQQAPIDTATPIVVEKIVEVEKVVEKIVEVAVPATPIVIEKIVEKEVEVPVEVIREVVVVVTATPASTPVPTATPMAMKTQAPVPLPATTAEPQDVQLRIIAINDFHGHIATSSDAFGGVGRVDYLAANISAARADYEHSVFVSAGDLIGGSPLVSALFHDEPTIEAMNLMGLDINSVGNHEFDDGIEELARMQQGGAHPTDGELDGDPFAGADFQFSICASGR
ncbi:MAG: metallophosphoesterase, partial [Chloroflexi bacterium]|nr:metallophosphoesterase [Chloroflexota bacterium]